MRSVRSQLLNASMPCRLMLNGSNVAPCSSAPSVLATEAPNAGDMSCANRSSAEWRPPSAAFLLIGMAIGRSQLHTLCIQHRLIMWGFGAAVLATIPHHLVSDPDLVEYLGTASNPPGPFYIMAGAGSSCVVIGLLLKMWKWLEHAPVAQALTAPGRQALTLYMAHILIGMGILEEAGLLGGSLNANQIVVYALAFCLFSSLYALIWSRWFKRGPLEALMRRVTEGKRS